MGIVFPTIPLSVMVEEGREAGELSSMILMDCLGVGIGVGLGERASRSLTPGRSRSRWDSRVRSGSGSWRTCS
jgi:hypothetical protein